MTFLLSILPFPLQPTAHRASPPTPLPRFVPSSSPGSGGRRAGAVLCRCGLRGSRRQSSSGCEEETHGARPACVFCVEQKSQENGSLCRSLLHVFGGLEQRLADRMVILVKETEKNYVKNTCASYMTRIPEKLVSHTSPSLRRDYASSHERHVTTFDAKILTARLGIFLGGRLLKVPMILIKSCDFGQIRFPTMHKDSQEHQEASSIPSLHPFIHPP